MPEDAIQFDNQHGETLAGTLHLPVKGAQIGVVLAHCFTCSRHTTILRRIADALAGAGLAALRFDFSGNGQSQGRFEEISYTKHAAEMLLAADYLARRNIETRGLLGHSMGAALAVLAGARMPGVRGICTLAGRLGGLAPTEFLTLDQQHQLSLSGKVTFTSRGRKLELTQAFFDDARTQDLTATIAALQRPLLVVHGDQDRVIPPAEAEKAKRYNPRQVTLKIIPGADHMFSRERDRIAIADMVAAWFERHAAA